MAKRQGVPVSQKPRRSFSKEFKEKAVLMMLDGHAPASFAKILRVGNAYFLYPWKADILARSETVAKVLNDQVSQLRDDLQRTLGERDICEIFQKGYANFDRNERWRLYRFRWQLQNKV